jgi:hypothetical protein
MLQTKWTVSGHKMLQTKWTVSGYMHICFEQEMQILPIFANTDSELVRGYNVEAVYRFTIQRNISQQQRHVLVFIPSW